MTLQEIHAYRNNDGTFTVHTTGEEYVCNQLCSIKGIVPRAILTIKSLTGLSSDEKLTLEIKEC